MNRRLHAPSRDDPRQTLSNNRAAKPKGSEHEPERCAVVLHTKPCSQMQLGRSACEVKAGDKHVVRAQQRCPQPHHMRELAGEGTRDAVPVVLAAFEDVHNDQAR